MTFAERSSIAWGTTRIAYAVSRSLRRSTVSIAIDPRDGVLVTAPTATPLTRLDRVVREKARWIVQRMRRQSDQPPPLSAREFVSGESYLYLGRQYRLRVERDCAEVRPLSLAGGWMRVLVPLGLDDEQVPMYVRAALIDWYRRHAATRLPEGAARWSRRIGVAEPRVLVREQKKRWASCDPQGVVRFNWRIIQASTGLVDYVVAHEIVHLVHHDHSRAFWRLLGRVMPDYERRRADLRAKGRTLEW